ncbi:hypothetical protein ACX80Z_15805 [Arthrobacter sp. TMT4-20]
MNDFLEQLAAQRAQTGDEEHWRAWVEKFGRGSDLWEVRGSASIRDSIQAFLKLVPENLMQAGVVVRAPRNTQAHSSGVPRVRLSNHRFRPIDPRDSPAARDRWVGAGKKVLYVSTVRKARHRDESDEPYDILQDGRVSGSFTLSTSADDMYKAMSSFVIRNRL